MTGTALPKHKPLRGNPQTNRIIKRKQVCRSHNPWTNPNESNYKLGLQYRIICMYHETSCVRIYGTAHGLY